MIYYENECCNCGLPCTFEACEHYKVLHTKCDFCHDTDIKLFHYNGWEICAECLLNEFDVVEGSDDWI
jgi:hypothetical protein